MPKWIKSSCALAAALRDALAHALDWLKGRAALQRSRRALAVLDDRMLRDIGLSRVDAKREAEKPFWVGYGPARPRARSATAAQKRATSSSSL